ncbi:hypothetical protein LK542_13365 [Massilia sp. IC2-477]|uniref:hypothetical protein n=1 Tax=Massilia sp. IC2-477 TaxID=2887198 RepID=UPI001D0FBA7C|nr:hypothetical protein [Massilia sp. IC2-477]MCC2956603.1 hypothetical protein [Massilia sp. IC2-477]
MKMIRKAIVIAACLMAAGAANAQLGGLGSMLAGAKSPVSGGDIGADVGTFVAKSAALGELAGQSVTAINAAFASDQEIEGKRAKLADIKKITDPAEKAAKFAELYKSEQAAAQTLLDSGEMEKRIGSLSSDKKKMIGQALLNFGIGGLQAVDLTKTGQSLIAKASANPLSLPKLIPVKDSLPVLGKVVTDSGSFLIGVLKVAKGANIAVQPATASSKAADFTF